MKTITVQIGNSDDKLTQKEWSDFALRVGVLVLTSAEQVHFKGTSGAIAPWQNAAWVFEIETTKIERVKKELSALRAEFRQNSVAWTEGETSFI